jgi:hypothetical protein
MTLKFNSPTQNSLVKRGEIEDEKSRKFIRKALGLTNKKVEATRHTILSGPPGVGKTYGTQDECLKGKVKYITLAPGLKDIQVAIKLAVAVYELEEDETLAVILDDADDLVFGDYDTLNKWKIAMGDVDYDMGLIPSYNHSSSMTNTISTLTKHKKMKIVEAIKSFQGETDIGLSIPTDRVRFIVLCNLDLEDPKSFGRSTKIKSAVGPLLDRFEYKRMDLNWETQWGWLAYTLSTTQPFDEVEMTDDQKKELLNWMYGNWNNLRSTSYRMVRKLAEDMINEPESYYDLWQEKLKGN